MKDLDADLRNLTIGYLRRLLKKLSFRSELPLSLKVIIALFAMSGNATLLFRIDHLDYPHDIMLKSVLVKAKNLFFKLKIKFNKSEYIDLFIEDAEYSLHCNDYLSTPKVRNKIKTIRGKTWKYKANTENTIKILITISTNGKNPDGIGCSCHNEKGAINIYISQDKKLPSERQVIESKRTALITLNVNEFMISADDDLVLLSYGFTDDVEMCHMHQSYCTCDLMHGPTDTYKFPKDPKIYKIYYKSNMISRHRR